MCHLHREIDHNQQLVACCLYTTEITKVQEWIFVELCIIDQQKQIICQTLTWNLPLDKYDLYQSITSRENPNNDIFNIL